MKRVHLVSVLVMLCALPVWQAANAQECQTKVYTPKHSDAGYLVSLLWGQTQAQMEARNFFPHFATQLIATAVEGLPRNDRRRVEGVCTWTYSKERPVLCEPMATPLAQPPCPSLCESKILLTGTPQAIAEAEAILQMYDVPRLGVYLHIQQADVPERDVERWGLEWTPLPPVGGDMSLGNSTTSVPMCKYAFDPQNVSLAYVEPRKPRLHVLSSEAGVVDGAQAIVALGEVVPMGYGFGCCEFTAAEECCSLARRKPGPCLARYSLPKCAKAIFGGIELWIRPMIEQDNRITIVMRPRLTEWAGPLCGELYDMVPLTRYQSALTSVTVGEDQSIVITGLHRDRYVVNQNIEGLDRRYHDLISVNPTLIITPYIVAPAGK